MKFERIDVGESKEHSKGMVLLVLLLSLFLPGCSIFIPQKVQLIPAGTKGDVYIILDIPKGEAVDRKGNTTTFRIPDSRILVSQYQGETSLFVDEYYYVSPNGDRTKLPVEYSSLHRTDESLKDTTPFIWAPSNGGSNWSDVPCEVKYEKYYVGNRAAKFALSQADYDEEYFKFEKFVKANVELLCEGKPRVNNTILKKPAR